MVSHENSRRLLDLVANCPQNGTENNKTTGPTEGYTRAHFKDTSPRL